MGDIFLEILHHGFGFPPALADDPDRTGEVKQGHNGLNTIFPAASDNLSIVINLFIVEHALLRLNPCPLNGETIGIQAGFLHQSDILGITVVVITCNICLFQ